MGITKERFPDYDILDREISWESLGRIFNHSGALSCRKLFGGNAQIYLRLNTNEERARKIKEFLKYGNVYKQSGERRKGWVYNLDTKELVLDFILNVKPYCPQRSRQIAFFLSEFNFSKGCNNKDFDFDKMRKMKEVHELLVKEQKLLLKKDLIAKEESGEQLTEEEKDYVEDKLLQGGEE